MWARRTIQSLEEVNGPMVRARKRKLTREQEKVIQLSKQFNVLSSLSTFIAIEHRSEAERNEGQPALRRVPVQIAMNWGGMEVAGGGPGGGVMLACAPMAMPAPAAPKFRMKRIPRLNASGLLGKIFGGGGGAHDAAAAPPPAQSPSQAMPIGSSEIGFNLLHDAEGPAAEDFDDRKSLDLTCDRSIDKSRWRESGGQKIAAVRTVHDILRMQEFNGDFHGDEAALATLLAQLGGTQWPRAVRQELHALVAAADLQKVVQTIVVLLLLRTKYQADAALWQRAARKAVRFLSGITQLPDIDGWLDELQEKLTAKH
jgi:hypothetical protein